MSLEIQRGKNPSFYARLKPNGVTTCQTLKTKVEGVVPKKLSLQGDVVFEKCRARAQMEHDELARVAREKRRDEEWLEKLYEAKTGNDVPLVVLPEMSTRWEQVTRAKAVRYIFQVKVVHASFIAFLGEFYPKVKEMADVSEPMARRFMALVEAEEFAPGTFNKKLDMLRSTFNYLASEAGIVKNPFNCIEEQEDSIVNRIPFTEEELELILDVAKRPRHALVYPAIMTASQTAMRRADCCLLLKTAINLAEDKITVRMAKTKKTIVIPLSRKLRDLLESLPESDSKYVFPDCAREFLRSPDSITDRTRSVFKEAGFFNPTPNGPKPKDSVQVVREKGKGVRAASTRDFQALRATWVTLALMNNIDIESVMAITGHTDEATLRLHYFLPQLEMIRNKFKKLPEVLGGNRSEESKTPATLAKVLRLVRSITSKNCLQQRKEILALTERRGSKRKR